LAKGLFLVGRILEFTEHILQISVCLEALATERTATQFAKNDHHCLSATDDK
jgi:hypothetical protein